MGGFYMHIYVYSDESGVFDVVHNDYYVFGGLIFLSKEEKEIASRKYIAAEKAIRVRESEPTAELKASRISTADKGKLFRSLNQYHKFGVVIDEKRVYPSIFNNKNNSFKIHC